MLFSGFDFPSFQVQISRKRMLCIFLALLTVFLVGPDGSLISTSFKTASAMTSVGDSEEPDYQVQQINRLIEQVWEAYEIKPSRDATDGEWCRRVYLDLIGRIPSVEELNQFLADRDSDKKRKLVYRLLYDDRYTEEFVRNWTTIWTNLLIGRSGGIENNSMISREGMQKYLRDSFAREKPYDRFVHELLTATGRTVPGSEEFNGATNFLIDKVNDEDAAQATAATSRLFLGLQVQCTQCHNHPFNDWKQQKYWEFNAFFRQVRAFRGQPAAGMSNAAAQLRDQDFAGESRRNPNEAELYYELRNGLLAVAYPVFVDGHEIPRSGYVKVVNRRERLADLMIESPYFSQAIVNRTWAHFLGYGFTTPVDDLGPHNIPSHPELLDYLSHEFRSSGFDLRTLMAWITLSRPYQLSSIRNKTNELDDPQLGESPKFSNFYIRQMEPEQLYESLMSAAEIKASGTYEEQERTKNRWLQQFNTAFGNDEGLEATHFSGTIPQILMMFNGELVKNAISNAPDTMISRLAAKSINERQKVEHLFLAGLSRKPTRKEQDMARYIFQSNNSSADALAEIWWVILNSNEFIFNH